MSDSVQTPPEDLVDKTGLFAGMNKIMGIASMIMIIGFVGFTISDVEYSGSVFSAGKDFIIGSLDWFYVFVMNAVLFFVFWLLISRFGDVKLGKDDDEPDFSTFSWICMLFSAGLGSGLIYWGVAEPMYHIADNPFLTRAGIEPGSVEAAGMAIRITNFHWGFHGWALYVLVGLSLAYFAYRKGLPLTLRSACYPVLKEKIYGPWGHLIDLIGVFRHDFWSGDVARAWRNADCRRSGETRMDVEHDNQSVDSGCGHHLCRHRVGGVGRRQGRAYSLRDERVGIDRLARDFPAARSHRVRARHDDHRCR